MPTRHPCRGIGLRGFTIIELLVVISLIAIVLTLSIPFVNAMQRQGSVEAGTNTVTVAVQTARQLSTRTMSAVEGPPTGPTSSYFGGTAAIFSPSGEIRIAEHDQMARENASTFLQDKSPKWFGYRDVPGLDFIRIPNGVLLKGIGRNDNGNEPLLLDPPFAIRFDQMGRLIVNTSLSQAATPPNTVDRMVFYDHNHNGFFTNVMRPASGSPLRPTYTIADYSIAANWDSSVQKHRLPFGRLETVVGVRIIDAVNSDHYHDIYFSRYTGTPLRKN